MTWIRENPEALLAALLEHLALVGMALALSLAIALPLGTWSARRPALYRAVLAATGILYTIPALALFALLIPLVGLGQVPAVTAIVLYSLLVLTRNVAVGLQGVPADVREAARGMGYGPVRLFWQVELPLALPSFMAGLRVATVSTVALVTVGVIVGHGGLGQLITGGFNANFYRAEIVTGAVGCVLLALLADLLLAGVERVLTPWARRARA